MRGESGKRSLANVEGGGFDLSIPGRETVKPSWEADLLSKRERICRGTEGSNPSPSSGESDANLTSSIRCEDESRHRPTMLLACLYVPCSADERGPGWRSRARALHRKTCACPPALPPDSAA